MGVYARQAVRTTEGSRHEDHVHGAHGVGEGAHDHSPVVYKPTQKELPLHEKPLAFLKKACNAMPRFCARACVCVRLRACV